MRGAVRNNRLQRTALARPLEERGNGREGPLFDNGAERTIVYSASLGDRQLERTAGSALQVLPLEDVRPRFRLRYIHVHPHCGHTKTVQ